MEDKFMKGWVLMWCFSTTSAFRLWMLIQVKPLSLNFSDGKWWKLSLQNGSDASTSVVIFYQMKLDHTFTRQIDQCGWWHRSMCSIELETKRNNMLGFVWAQNFLKRQMPKAVKVQRLKNVESVGTFETNKAKSPSSIPQFNKLLWQNRDIEAGSAVPRCTTQ